MGDLPKWKKNVLKGRHDRAQRRTWKGGEGSEAHSKGGRVMKHTTLNARGLKGALERRWGLRGTLERR